VFKSITVVGLGTLGGFVCRHVSELDSVEELVVVDFDIVENKDIFKSVYNYSHIGEYKVDAITRIVDSETRVIKINTMYIEGKTKIPKTDLVLDCRDIVCSRKKEIDAKLFISGKLLIIDCRKNVTSNFYKGKYLIRLSKSEISKAAFFVAQLISSGQLKKMIDNQLVQRLSLELIHDMLSNSIKTSLNNKIDIIFERATPRLHIPDDSIKPLLSTDNDIEVFVGEKKQVLELERKDPQLAKLQRFLITRDSFETSTELVQYLSKVVDLQTGCRNFFLTVQEEDGKRYIELIEETGAA